MIIYTILFNIRIKPSHCRANEYNKQFLYERYLSYIQDLVTLPGLVNLLTALAEVDPKVRAVKGMLRLRPGTQYLSIELFTLYFIL